MKKVMLILLIIFLATPVWAQNRPAMPRYKQSESSPASRAGRFPELHRRLSNVLA